MFLQRTIPKKKKKTKPPTIDKKILTIDILYSVVSMDIVYNNGQNVFLIDLVVP